MLCFAGLSRAFIRMPAGNCTVAQGGGSSSFPVNQSNDGIIQTAWNVGDVYVSCPVSVQDPSVYHNLAVYYTDGNPSTAFVVNACVDYYFALGGTCYGSFSKDPPSFVTAPYPGGTVSVQEMFYPTFPTWQNNPADFAYVSIKIPASQFSGGLRQNSSTLRGIVVIE